MSLSKAGDSLELEIMQPVERLEMTASNTHLRKQRNGIVLVPQPSDDPLDPLNWPQSKKYFILLILSLSAFGGMAASLANQLAFAAQGKLYNKSLIEMSYSISAAVAGLAYGPLLLVCLAERYGRSALILWSSIGIIACGIWAALMTSPNDYCAFIMSRLLGGIFGACPSVLGNGIITDIFFLHERGRAFSTFHLSFLLGTLAGPTLGGFIVAHVSWPVEFWWAVGFQSIVGILGFFFLEETSFDRQSDNTSNRARRKIVRFEMLFRARKGAGKASWAQVGTYAVIPLKIGIAPVSILMGLYTFICFGWYVMINTLLTVFLEEPIEDGGYGMTTQQNAAFTFSLWIGVFVAQLWGYLLNDRIPLWISKRREGVWKPEYRLHSLWIPGLVLPLGLGIFGASLQYHLHFMVLALGSFLTTFSTIQTVPVAVNYVAECFPSVSTQAGVVMGTYRLSFGLAIPFFIKPWIAAVGGPGWVFGMAALLSIFAYASPLLLVSKGDKLRAVALPGLTSTSDNIKVFSARRARMEEKT